MAEAEEIYRRPASFTMCAINGAGQDQNQAVFPVQEFCYYRCGFKDAPSASRQSPNTSIG